MAVQLREVPSNRWGAQSRGVAFLELRWLPPLPLSQLPMHCEVRPCL